ncbi:MAG: 23S rRNA (guanosine(2251)-2'-O)-methyltransferase RlmB [Arthrobacter sp.]|uniref:23S rRNA (guanosine(2251)-2'-O)-methyltransferase RlmB n=1 Tax=unclassified Arthrobacter TaxID=235627 RepID=UPI0026546419|nr:23S rRNA (guanosine(2251)-2'-O)-methyltransferase RlmB [Micrococcaceae bacterium]MDN5879976.1 23S rRNA (guanosine(2251)-2'-O)-methyltransferase RlmB [Micrococcaceae bacterium]MDN5887399.1 23S rRNA (guanosine(2251)-2'-O)-methyltransferase RlmB [Micrococcaceae bacterium]MDN5905966.1 23S rRNA (guanosine(2251)-2'-O)-methyltransferase RlmB [Micrococcaceae bacterium]MDN6178222.1 23S rRNA (guanosine(2251)-2'-O)-methyltransferase RlmB [Micrococcaceae bacterium]
MATPKRHGGAPKKKKGPTVGTGGHGRKSLEGKGPTPKAEERTYHQAYRSRQLAERAAAKPGATRQRPAGRGGGRSRNAEEMVSGRNSVLEALRADIPAKALYLAIRIDVDDRVREILKLAADRGLAVMETGKPELDRMTDESIHQGLALQVPPYDYPDALETVKATLAKVAKGHLANTPLFIALDGITDPRNLGAIIRSASAFGAHAVIVPERRSAGLTASAWKTSAGAAARVPVARATNLTNTLKAMKQAGVYVVGLDGDGDVDLTGLPLATEPLCIVVGSEGKGLSRLVKENCDQIVSIPIESAMESLNASMAVGITLYEIARLRND